MKAETDPVGSGPSQRRLDVLEAQILKRLCGRIQGLRLCWGPRGLTIEGRVDTYFARQLAEAVLGELTTLPVHNQILIR